MMEPEFLSLGDVFVIHEAQIASFGGLRGVRDEGLLESAVMTPQASFGGEYLHSTLFEMAAAYAFHIAENQPFLDGNKRTALASALVFLDLNGFVIVDPDHKLYAAMIAISAKQLGKSNLASLLESLTAQD